MQMAPRNAEQGGGGGGGGGGGRGSFISDLFNQGVDSTISPARRVARTVWI